MNYYWIVNSHSDFSSKHRSEKFTRISLEKEKIDACLYNKSYVIKDIETIHWSDSTNKETICMRACVRVCMGWVWVNVQNIWVI